MFNLKAEMSRIIALGLILVAAIALAVGIIAHNIEAEDSLNDAVEAPLHEPTRAELVMKAIAEAYPQVTRAEFRNNDWAVLLDDTWYYYAEGRLLPEEFTDRIQSDDSDNSNIDSILMQ